MVDQFYFIIFTIALLVGIGAFCFGTAFLTGQRSKIKSRLIYWSVVISILLLATFPFVFSFLNTLRKQRASQPPVPKQAEVVVEEPPLSEEFVKVVVSETKKSEPSEEATEQTTE